MTLDGKLRKKQAQETPVEAKTANYTIVTADDGKIFTNEGTTALVILTLPTAVAGFEVGFLVLDTDGIKIQAATGDTIRVFDQVSVSAGVAQSTVSGSTLYLIAIDATSWVTTDGIGTWDVT